MGLIERDIGFYYIADPMFSKNGILKDVSMACDAGVKIVQYRNKNGDAKTLYKEALELKNICKSKGALLIINDRVDILLAVDADGVHLGQNDIPYPVARKILGKEKIIGVSTHSLQEATIAYYGNADYIGFGAIFKTSTKEDALQEQGIQKLKDIRKLDIPIVAIGGITIDNAIDVIEAGADGLCSISDVQKGDSIFSSILSFQMLFNKN
ncbi:thiamine phosphate synthase [bacterium]|nr:thiamine phosphate synthase [bacterium]